MFDRIRHSSGILLSKALFCELLLEPGCIEIHVSLSHNGCEPFLDLLDNLETYLTDQLGLTCSTDFKDDHQNDSLYLWFQTKQPDKDIPLVLTWLDNHVPNPLPAGWQ